MQLNTQSLSGMSQLSPVWLSAVAETEWSSGTMAGDLKRAPALPTVLASPGLAACLPFGVVWGAPARPRTEAAEWREL